MVSMIDAAIVRARSVLMVFALLLFSGIWTYIDIAKESNPDITMPQIYVSIVHDGISPEDAERMLVRPMEFELKSIEGIEHMRAVASEGHASITLEFVPGFDAKQALADVRDRVTLAKAKLPSESEEPVVREVTMANMQPAVTIFLSGAVTERGLIGIARDLRDKIASMEQVLEVDIGGEREDMLEIIVDPLLMESYALDQADIFSRVSRSNRLVPAGTLDTGKGRFAVKVPSVFEDITDLLQMPIKVDGDRVVTFADIAIVRRAYKDATSYARFNGERAISIEVKKRPGENIIETVDRVKQLVAEQRKSWPEHIDVDYTGDQSRFVKDVLTDLQNNVISAVVLVIIVIIAALGARTASLVALAIPGSFLTGVLALSMLGLTVNIVVLFGLIMSVGMLVDGAIVVTEFADRQMNEGVPKQQAYSKAAKRMAWPIINSTATTLAAFAPLLFWPGMMGEFMKYLPITLICVLLASLFMALVFIPTMGAMWGKARYISERQRQYLTQSEDGDITQLPGFSGKYVRLLEQAISYPKTILALTLLFALGVFTNYHSSQLGTEFFPTIEPDGINLIVRSYGDLSIDEKDDIMREVERRILDIEGLKSVYTRVGGNDANTIGRLRLNLLNWQQRKSASELVDIIHQRVDDYAGVQVEVRKDNMGPQQGKDVTLELSSRYPDLLQDAVRKVARYMDHSDAFINIEDGASKPGIEWQLKVNRTLAASFDADASLLGTSVQMVTNGVKIGEYRPDDVDDEVDIRVRFPAEQRSISKLEQLRLKTDHGLVPVTNFVEQSAAQKVDSIYRIDSRRVVTVSADLADSVSLSNQLEQLQHDLQQLDIDWLNVTVKVTGENEDQQESQQFLSYAFTVALFIIGIILVSQFNSFYQSALILSAVLLSTVGVFFALLIGQQPFGIVMSGLGVIALAGIVVNNNIVLIDTYNVLRQQGRPAKDAILRTGLQRLRPVLLTTVTTVLGLLPMVMQVNIDFISRNVTIGAPSTQWWAQLATAVVGGLTFATVLTLILTPCLLALRDYREQPHSNATWQPAPAYEEI
ncbi:efflux RND transporter permease subunit [Thalassotalea ponticola]|uniref:efflux RND transporter permease subunit n=1 Tax=Thalassotalea ponticola TaxID=1523392 RepID=UPI0025B3884C|nr:efflux RND transporter permease subunit [Thalassotalea ponticola]MDN3653484.1 efflux RND transporter permease subunit [Thalassotalea ponticola]